MHTKFGVCIATSSAHSIWCAVHTIFFYSVKISIEDSMLYYFCMSFIAETVFLTSEGHIEMRGTISD